MNRVELSNILATETGFTKKDSKMLVSSLINIIQRELVKGEKINFPGFGSFYTVERTARKGHHPKTGVAIEIPSAMMIKFKGGQTLKREINK